MRDKLVILIFAQLGLLYSSASQATGYELGRGWHGGNYYLSGYTNFELAENSNKSAKLSLDDLSLFAGGRINQWINPFTEVELSKFTLIQQGGGGANGDVLVERLYNDALISEHDALRVGKILTPLGNWNMVHAAPLTPTITRPYSTARGFDAYVSGINWVHDPEDGTTPDWQLYWQPDSEWFKRPLSLAPRNFHNVIGGHVNMPLGLIDKVGASIQHGQLVETGETFILYGINANKYFGRLKLESEAITSHFSGAVLPGTVRYHGTESGIFALADYAITAKWHGILEGERYQDHTVESASRNILLAVNFRPSAPMVWKLEYVHQAGSSTSFASILTGWKAAVSLLF